MRVYNKRTFIEGTALTILGLVLFAAMFLTSYDIKKVIISTLALLVGTGLLQRGLSKALSREDKTDELDERNQYISLKAKGKSLQVTQIISWILMLILLVIGGKKSDTLLITFGLGIMIPFMISLFGELFCVIYYEMKH